MNPDSSSNSNSIPVSGPVTSQLGRQWLQSTNGNEWSENGDSTSKMVIVTIPDVSDAVDPTQGAFDIPIDDQDQLAAALTIANQELLAETATGGSLPKINPDSFPTPQSETTGPISIDTTDQATIAPHADLAEPSTDWTEKPSPKETSRTKPGEKPKQSKSGESSLNDSNDSTPEQSQAILTLANAIIERFPLGDPTVLTFVGSEANPHIDETCARLAAELADRKIGRVLLLDADTVGKSLSKASGVGGETGMTDVVNKSVAWESAIYGRSSTGLDFMGVGTGSFSHAEAESRLRHVVAEMKREYQFICISAGDAHSQSAKMWNDICDGSYLLVSVKNTNETFAKSAVAEMRSSGARLLGCVVTDVD